MTPEIKEADWIAVDWGTSNVRAWCMHQASPIAEASADTGMGSLPPDQFEQALLALIEPWLDETTTTIVACGMVGARQGWCEAPYAMVPCSPVGGKTTRPKTQDRRLDVHILPGLAQKAPPDVMRGEETQIAGYLARDPDFDGILCLPGTHTKWVHISAGEVVSFRTFMTGELFNLIGSKSVLRHSIDTAWDDATFREAVRDAMGRPEAISSRLFSLRAADLLSGPPPGRARAQLSGLLIGAELAASRPYWLGQRLVLIGAEKLAGLYGSALQQEGLDPETADASAITLTGLHAAYTSLKEAP